MEDEQVRGSDDFSVAVACLERFLFFGDGFSMTDGDDFSLAMIFL